MIRFVLASASPARHATLLRAGVRPEVLVSGIDEDALIAQAGGAGTAELVQQLAVAKAHAVVGGLSGAALVLGCDSLLDLQGRALGKPQSRAAAVERWYDMRGKSGVLHTGHCLIELPSGRSRAITVSTAVHFAELTDAEIELYCGTGEPWHVAGAFTVDGLGGWFVDGVEGDHHNVVGLSLPGLRRMLHDLGYTIADLGYPAAE